MTKLYLDIEEIKNLSVGHKHDIDGILESMSVFRYKQKGVI